MSSRWEDANGNSWRYSSVSQSWQRQVNGSWVTSPLPSGGLNRVTATDPSPGVVIVETMGPQGQIGPLGPVGPVGPRGEPGVVILSETLPSQFQNGTNLVFPLSQVANTSQAVQVFRNGLMEIPGQGFLATSTSVTFTTPPLVSDVLTVVYQKAQ